MKKLWTIIICVVLFSGCEIANTPTSKVEDYLSKYQKMDDDISASYSQLSGNDDISEENREDYQELVEKQYKGLSYEVKEEVVDGDVANVTVQVKVSDYKEILDKYNREDYDNVDEYHEEVIEGLEEQKDKITYTIIFELELNDKDEWEVLDLSLEDKDKLLGIY